MRGMSVIVCTARSAWLALLLSFGLVAAIPAQPTPPYQAAQPSADGIGKTYHGREIARMMGFDGAAWLERTERQQEERADLLMAELALKPGMDVADVGAGTGYYSRRMSLQVGPKGKVYAIEVQPQISL